MKIKWKKYPYDPRYKINTSGGVFGRRGHLLSPKLYRGYLFVDLGRNKRKPIHQLVLETFLSKRPDGMITRHLNGIKTDNRIENLVWGTIAENNKDTELHGGTARGEKHPKAKLTNKEAEKIRELYKTGSYTQRKLGVIYDIHHTKIARLLNGVSYR